MKMQSVITGESITNAAREAFYERHDLEKAMLILREALVTDDLTYNQVTLLMLQILNYDADIVGRTDDGTYGIKFRDDIDENKCLLQNVMTEFKTIVENKETLEKEHKDILRKYLFLYDNISDREKERINKDYYEENGEYMFGKNEFTKPSIVNEYLSRQKRNMESSEEVHDYGWLSPDGTFYPVEWGDHTEWAYKYAEEHYPYKKNSDKYWKEDGQGNKKQYVGGDFLIYCCHWVLIDSPMQGEGRPQYDRVFGMTKAQKEFMYDYYMQRGRNKEANELWLEAWE